MLRACANIHDYSSVAAANVLTETERTMKWVLFF
jgi:hypothetical protein